jgi:hypothetical protein
MKLSESDVTEELRSCYEYLRTPNALGMSPARELMKVYRATMSSAWTNANGSNMNAIFQEGKLVASPIRAALIMAMDQKIKQYLLTALGCLALAVLTGLLWYNWPDHVARRVCYEAVKERLLSPGTARFGPSEYEYTGISAPLNTKSGIGLTLRTLMELRFAPTTCAWSRTKQA